MEIAKKTFLLSAFLALVLSGVLFSELWGVVITDIFKGEFWGGPLTKCAYTPPDDTWFNISMIALLLNLVFVGFAYVLSGALGARVQAWSKRGVVDFSMSAIIVVALFMASNMMYDRGISQIDIAQRNAIIIRDTMLAEFGLMTTATAALSLVGNITPYLRPAGIIGISFSLQPAFRPIFDGLGITLSMMTVAISEWFAHEFLLCFVKTRMLAFIMPIGIFLRALGPTVRAGNALIAIAIGLFFVYPFMLNVTTYSIEVFFNGQYEDASGMRMQAQLGQAPPCWVATATFDNYQPCFFGLVVEKAVRDIGQKFTDNPWGALSAGGMIFAVVQFFTGSIMASLLIEAAIFFMFAVFKASLFYIVIVSVLMPLFNIFITLTLIREIAAALGTEIDLSALEKII